MTIACIVVGPRPTLPLVATASVFGIASGRCSINNRFSAKVGSATGRRVGTLATQHLPGD